MHSTQARNLAPEISSTSSALDKKMVWLFGHWLWGLVIGVILLDLGVQSTQVSNQTRVYSLNPEASNRLNTIYMVSYFVGGSLGTALGTYGWSVAHWNGVCVVGIAMLIVAIAWYLFSRKSAARSGLVLRSGH